MPKRFDVRSLRERLDISQVDLAEKMGVAPRTIQRWENAEADPSPLAIRRLHEIDDEYRGTHSTSTPASSTSPPSSSENRPTPVNNPLTRAAGLVPSLG